jgi:Inositol phosphatase
VVANKLRIVNDYFSQAAIDFLLGNVTSLVFEDFESNLMSGDPAVSMRKVRQQAIEVSQRVVIADETEDLIGGWALLTPHDPNTIRSVPFEEAVLLLTDAALYACRFDWNMEKVSSFERVDLRHVVNIKYGTYITSTLSPIQADETRNVGFVVTYKAGANDITRVNTRSLSTKPSREDTDLLHGTTSITSMSLPSLLGAKAPPSRKILAFKALPARSAVAEEHVPASAMSEIEQVRHICREVERMVLAGKRTETAEAAEGDAEADKGKEGEEGRKEKKGIIEEGDIISLAEARRSTGLLEQLGHSLKKLVWA